MAKSSGDEVAETIFTIAAVILFVALIVTIAVIVFGATLIAGLIWGAISGTYNFFQTFRQSHDRARTRPVLTGQARFLFFTYELQPARLIYPLGAGWWVMRDIATTVWEPTAEDAGKWYREGEKFVNRANALMGKSQELNQVFLYAGGIGICLGSFLCFVVTFLFVAIFLILQFLILLIPAGISLVAMSILGVGAWLYASVNKIYARCWNCGHQMPIPVHICPDCAAEHSRLWPSIYGIFYHRCMGKKFNGDVCGRKLLTIGWLRREKLTQRCPECSSTLEGLGGTNIHLPIVGGRSSGKSHFIVSSLSTLKDIYLPSRHMTMSFPDKFMEKSFADNEEIIKQGKILSATVITGDAASAYTVRINKPRTWIPKLLYIYDAAGEYWKSQNSAVRQNYFRYAHGVVFMIDPFSLPAVRKRYALNLAANPNVVSASEEDPLEVYSRMLTTFQTYMPKGAFEVGQRFHTPVAIVVSKTDAFDLEDLIGLPAAKRMRDEIPHLTSLDDAMSLVVEKFLQDNGIGELLRNLRDQFSQVRCFSCSAFGFGPETSNSPYEGERVLNPLLWLLANAKAVPATHERAAQADGATHTRLKTLGRWGRLRGYLWDSLNPIQQPTANN